MSSGRIPLAGVIGHPIGHSKSPLLHGHWLKEYDISGHYIPMDVAPDDLEAVLRALPRAGFVGVNVTIPHKEAALALADVRSTRATEIGAANTLSFMPDGVIEADNTDGYGFLENLRDRAHGWSAREGPAAVFGAGGACRAVLVALMEAGAPEILLTNRSQERAERLAESFGPRVRVIDWRDGNRIVENSETIVNTTSLGMSGQPEFPFSLEGLKPGAVATDIVYTPLDTQFLQLAGARGARCVDGLGMLLHQAVPGFARWFGRTPTVTNALRDAVLSA